MGIVTNQKKRIATKASKYEEANPGVSDMCQKLDGSDDTPYKNRAPLANAIEHTSDSTLFENGNVIGIGDAILPSIDEKNEGKHPKRANGGPYQMEARATQGAPNVFCECVPPTRKLDRTTQDAENSRGNVVDPGNPAEIARLEEDEKKRCSLKEDDIWCKHGRHIVTGETRALEVTSDQKDPEMITFKAERINAVEPGKADCMFGEGAKHTEWVITRVKGGGLDERIEPIKGKDVIYLDSSWLTGDAPETHDVVTGMPEEPDRLHKHEAAMRNQDRMMRPITGGIPQSIQDGAKKDDDAAHEKAKEQFEKNKTRRSLVVGAMYFGEQAINLRAFLKVFFWRRDPVKINVQAQACTGSLQTDIIVFPAEEIVFTFGKTEYELIQAVCRPIEAFAALMKRISEGLGFGSVEVELLKDPEVEAKVQWKELTKDAPKAGLKKYQCGRIMSLSLGIGKIIGLKFEFRFPIARLLDFIPGAGWIVDKAISVFGIEASCGLGVTLDIGLKFKLAVDEYWEFTDVGRVELSFDFKFYLFLRVAFRNNFRAEAQAVVNWKPTFTGPYFHPDEICFAKLEKGDVRIGFEATLQVSVLWWEHSWSGEIYPESWRYNYGEQELHFMRPIQAMLGR